MSGSYVPRGWRKLFPYYWELGRALEARDREAERQVHRDVDEAFQKAKLEHLKALKKQDYRNNPVAALETEQQARIGAERTHHLLEQRGIRR